MSVGSAVDLQHDWQVAGLHIAVAGRGCSWRKVIGERCVARQWGPINTVGF